MKIECTTTFLDQRDRFEKGEMLATETGQGCRVVSPEAAQRFIDAGWAREPGQDVLVMPAGEVTLVVDNVAVSHTAEVPRG